MKNEATEMKQIFLESSQWAEFKSGAKYILAII